MVIIEDDRPSRELLTVYLVGTAAEVTVARDGPSGLDAVRRVHPAVVLLDIRLPGIDGWAVLEALKSDSETRDIPVIVVSIIDERARGAPRSAPRRTSSSRSVATTYCRALATVTTLPVSPPHDLTRHREGNGA